MKVVIVAHDFMPGTTAGAIRPHVLAAGLSDRGHEVMVLTSQADPVEGRYRVFSVPYRSFGSIAKQSVGIPAESNAAEIARNKSAALERVTRLAARGAETLLMHPDKQHRWIGACRAWFERNGTQLSGADAVLATSPPVSGAYVGRDLSRALDAPLVVDFRDLWTENKSYPYPRPRRRLDQAAERRLLSSARSVAVATSALAERLARGHPGIEPVVIENGLPPLSLPAAPAAESRASAFRVGVFGRTYEGRADLSPLVRAIARLCDRKRDIPRDLRPRLDVFGDRQPGSLALAESLGIAESVEFWGVVPRERAMQELAATHLAVAPMFPDDTDSIPLKTIEYLAAGRTILIVGAASDAAVRAAYMWLPGVVMVNNDVEALAQAIGQAWDAWLTGDDLYWSPSERPTAFTAENLVDSFEALLQSVARNGTDRT